VWRWDLQVSAFGEHAANEDPDADGSVVKFNLRFPGQYLDAETGLHYNYFRDYEAATGRYVESDPIGLRGEISTYGYALASPFGFADELGLSPKCSKGGKKNLGTEGFNTKSDPKDVEDALREAIKNKRQRRAAALRALLKVIKRGGSMGFGGLAPELFKYRCEQGDSMACESFCTLEPTAPECQCDWCET
jgi:RHS repeat-associated protein